jgi:Flp pilus assembly protein TadB
VADRAPAFRTGGAGWWVTLAVMIGAAAALAGTALQLQTLWVAIAAGAVGAVLPAYLDGRRRRRHARSEQDRPVAAPAQRERTGSAPAQRA